MDARTDRASMLLEPMNRTGVEMPEGFVLWNKDPKDSQRLAMVNVDDFPKKFILKSLGMEDNPLTDSFGLCDPEEIEGRLGIMNWLVADKERRAAIRGLELNDRIPAGPNDYIEFFHGRLPYWSSLETIGRLITPDAPPRLQRMKRIIADSAPLAEAEGRLRTAVIDRICKISCFSGDRRYVVTSGLQSVTIEGRTYNRQDMSGWNFIPDGAEKTYYHSVDCLKGSDPVSGMKFDKFSGECYGYSQYSCGLSEAVLPQAPKWVNKPKWHPARWTGAAAVAKWVTGIRRKAAKERCNKSRRIVGVPPAVDKDIASYLASVLNEDMPQANLSGYSIRVYFDYHTQAGTNRLGRGGLEVFVYGFAPETCIPRKGDDFAGVSERSFEGFSDEEQKELGERFDVIRKRVCDYRETVGMVKTCYEANGKFPSFVAKKLMINSPCTDSDFRWFAASNICSSESVLPLYNEMIEHRRYFNELFNQLRLMVDLADNLCQASKKLDTGVCVAEIAKDRAVTSFGTLFPVQLLADVKAKDIVPISGLPDVNGVPVGFTGFHGGGKTETMLAVVASMWLLQSGIPPLGRGKWVQNVKKLLGFVFIDNVRKHSTCQRLVSKMTALFKAMEGVPPADVVAVLDELGTGTQEDDGLRLGMDVLSECHARKVAVLFTTQIQDLAKFAEDKLGASCFKFDAKHRLSPGIGKGGMDMLRKEQGLDKYLSHSRG